MNLLVAILTALALCLAIMIGKAIALRNWDEKRSQHV